MGGSEKLGFLMVYDPSTRLTILVYMHQFGRCVKDIFKGKAEGDQLDGPPLNNTFGWVSPPRGRFTVHSRLKQSGRSKGPVAQNSLAVSISVLSKKNCISGS
jgi:hypothetical protein